MKTSVRSRACPKSPHTRFRGAGLPVGKYAEGVLFLQLLFGQRHSRATAVCCLLIAVCCLLLRPLTVVLYATMLPPSLPLYKEKTMLQILILALAIAISSGSMASSDPPTGSGGGGGRTANSSDPPTGGGGGGRCSDPPTGGGGGCCSDPPGGGGGGC